MRVNSAKQSKNEICQIFRIDFQFIISGIEREREKTEYLWRRRRNYPELGMREDNRRKREREREKRERDGQTEKPTRGWPPSPESLSHVVKNGVPRRCFHVCAKIFIKALSGPAVLESYFQSLSDFEVVDEFFFCFFHSWF